MYAVNDTAMKRIEPEMKHFSFTFQICTKCVKCRSCGATTPGAGKNAVWMNDFSLCYECGQLMAKGGGG